MTKDTRDRWVRALRGGEYKQITGSLKVSGGYCCLGVLCDLVNPLGWDSPLDEYSTHHGFDDFPAPQTVGLAQIWMADVADMNDKGKSFAEIADWIEANVPVDA